MKILKRTSTLIAAGLTSVLFVSSSNALSVPSVCEFKPELPGCEYSHDPDLLINKPYKDLNVKVSAKKERDPLINRPKPDMKTAYLGGVILVGNWPGKPDGWHPPMHPDYDPNLDKDSDRMKDVVPPLKG